MLYSLTNYFRATARTVPRLRPNAPSIASSSRWFCATPASRNQQYNPSAGQELYNAVVEAADTAERDAATRTGQDFETIELKLREIDPQPTSPGWYTRNARIQERRRPSKPWKLGPNAQESRELDPFYQLGINPLHEATNSRLLSSFVTEMGKIRSRAETNLTWKTQRRLAKAIRRAKMMGIIPILSRRELMSKSREVNIRPLATRRYLNSLE